ncbi:nucleoside ABC transporter membrane protein [Roseiarcus fermentans]|uniref:Nucleoside ABC transporter membrane protein n=1 Tax=Roseiarcus fermentans TaxID=1473586 RepID=A0A366FE10_9HYPH|nr:ABC transporter permease [Roseiarcus fermentans]RBP12847.1 nucleoside ABC transporter membrane protein [Roseiarcus fermentans]
MAEASSPGAPPAGASRGFGRLTIEVRRSVSPQLRIGALAGAIAIGLTISAIALVLAGVPASDLAQEFIVATLFDPTNLKAVFVQAAPLVLVGLSAAMAFRVRFWNLGIEGQMIFGGVGATAVSLAHAGPDSTRLVAMFVAAMLAGAAWAAIPAALKLLMNVNEIISTLLLNYVASDILLHLLYGVWKDQDGFPHSLKYSASELIPDILPGANGGLVIAAAAAALLVVVTARSRAGVYMRFVSASPSVAEALGVPVRPLVFSTVLLSGALAAVAGFVVASSQEGRLTQSFYQGYGVSGVLIGFLARNNPFAAAIVGVLMATLVIAGQNLQVFYGIPQSMVQLIQAVIVMCVAASDFLTVHRLHWAR